MALNKLTADALVDGTLDADAIGPASITTAKLHSNIISGQTAIGSVDVSNDLLLIYDNDATSLKKVPVSSVGATNTDGLTEGSSNLYYTNARADARITNAIKDEDNMASNSATHVASQQSVKAYVDTEVAGLVASAPGTLDTLNELAAALGDDANFSTTVTNSIATKLPLAGGTMTGDLVVTKNSAAIQVNESSGATTKLVAGGSLGYVGTYSNHSLQLLVNSTPKLVIDTNGDVGIGTTSPDTLLHLSGNDTAVIRLENSDTSLVGDQLIGGLEFEKTDPSGAGAGVVGGVRMHSASSNGADAYLALSTASSSANNVERMRINENGYVGIGTDNPGTKLHVDGGGSQPEIRVSQNSTYFTDIGVNHIDVNGPNDLRFLMGGAQKARLTSGGVLALGSGTPGSWSANYPALTIGQGATLTGHASNTQTQLGQNWWIGTGNQYIVNGAASRLVMNPDSTIIFSQAPSGTANATMSTTNDRLVINPSGNVGIGATSPVTGHKMTIKETATENASIVFTDTDDMVGAYVGMAKGNNEITTGATNIDLVLGTAYIADTHLIANNAIGLTLKNGGNVGIGVTAPQFKLHVNKGSGNYAPASGVVENIAGFQTNYNSAGSQILTYANLDGNWIDGTSGANSASGWLWGYENNVRGGLVYDHRGSERMQLFSAYGALTLMTSDSADGTAVPTDSNMNERLTILPGGNVGIGTTNPLGKLHVGFSGRAGIFIGSTNGGGSYLLLDGAGNGDGAGSDYAYIEHQSSGNLAFNVGNSSNSVTEKMTILPGGYVGINTTSPQRALHIHDHSATGLHITNTQSGAGANDGFSQYIRDDNQATELMVRENSYLGFGTNNTLRAKILNSGELFWPEISNRGDLTFPICSISNAGAGGQYLHAQFQSYGGVMLHIHFRGYEYIGNSMREGSGGGYVYNTSGQQVIYAQAYSGHCVQVYQTTTNRVELVINTGSGATGNRWGSYVFFGGTDTITGDTPLTLVQYGWNSSTGRLYSS